VEIIYKGEDALIDAVGEDKGSVGRRTLMKISMEIMWSSKF